MRAEGCSREAAERRVAAGEWTDDDAAARYLGGSRPTSGGAADGRSDRVAPPDSWTVRRTVDALADLGESDGAGEPPDRDDRSRNGEGSR